MNVLVINSGSSSLKFQLFEMPGGQVKAKGLCERIGIDGRVKLSVPGRDEFVQEISMPDHADAIKITTDLLVSPEFSVISDLSEIGAIGHRYVHGGKFSKSVLATPEVIAELDDCIDLAPLHSPPNLTGIKACAKVMPGVPQVIVFDTAFHQTMPQKAYLYALPYEYYEKYQVRRYGFHGTSHYYVANRAAQMLGKPVEQLKLVTCHLGNGSSIAAVDGGKCVDTSMGFTPLEGLPMGTRCGNIDPAIMPYVMKKEGIDIDQMLNVMNKTSGVLGISGVSPDFRDVENAAKEGNERAGVALDIFVYDVKKYIGAYAAAMGGIDALVFTAGIGENNIPMRVEIVEGLEFLGLEIDKEINNARGKELDVSKAGAKAKVLVIPTNEELVIATDAFEFANK